MRILLVEDDAKLGPLLVRVLGAEGYAVTLARSAKEGERLATARDLECIVLDRMLPDGDGLELCAKLRRARVETPILLLTARSEIRDRVEGLDTGADDYLTKPFEIDELVARLRALRRRAPVLGSIDVGAIHIDRVNRNAFVAGALLALTGREYDLILYLANHAEQAVAKSRILDEVWEGDVLATNLVEVNISRLRDKLGEHAWMLQTVRGEGYRLRAKPDS